MSKEKYFVLTFLVTNQNEGEFFYLFEEGKHKRNHKVKDNFGNQMDQFIPEFDIISVEGNIEAKLLPGETRIVKAICEAPLSTKADKFIWEMRLVVDNRSTVKEAAIQFSRKDILFSP
jgi:hypothetical protein